MSKPYELLARFNKDGTIAGCHVRTITTVDGRDFESDPIPLKDATHEEFTKFAESFSASLVAERDSLVKDKEKLTTDLDAMTKELDGYIASQIKANSDLVDLRRDHAKALEDAAKELAETQDKYTTSLVEVNAKHDEEIKKINAENEALKVEVARLETMKSFDDSLISIDAFMARIRPEFEWLVIEAQTDQGTAAILKLLLTKKGTKEIGRASCRERVSSPV